jgi:hypothetical protein
VFIEDDESDSINYKVEAKTITSANIESSSPERERRTTKREVEGSSTVNEDNPGILEANRIFKSQVRVNTNISSD